MSACARLFDAAACEAPPLPRREVRYHTLHETESTYVGTYGENSKGIYSFRFDPYSGDLTPIGLAAEVANPSFLAIHPNRKFLYAVSELGNDGKTNGSVTAFAIDRASGMLTKLNTVSSGGGGSCHLVVDH